ncbi:PadR family transcriptional regulator [Caulobacter sp.]|uniref:PadR family transcriptional regulator n=1 Tax=Caulobacter sp. TaxID=78 RepID=UPI00341BA968
MRVLEALLEAPNSAGADIVKSTGLATGTVYPILLRLEGARWLSSCWEEGEPSTLGRPRRRFYSVTAEGARAARQAALKLHEVAGRLAWS